MKNVKWFMAVLPLVLTLSFTARADDALSAKSAGEMLAQASISRYLKPEYQKMLQKVLLGQGYEYRVSVIDTRCQTSRGVRSCVFSIGTDDLNDGDRGWGATYELTIETEPESSHMLSAEMHLSAG